MTIRPEEVFEACLERIREGGDADEILRQHPESAAELRALLALTIRVQEMPNPPVTGLGMVKALVRQAAVEPVIRPATRRRRLLRFTGQWVMRAAVVFFALVLVGWASSAVSMGAVPGDALYPLKLFTEKARFYLSVNEESQTELRILFSDRRLREAVQRCEQGGGIDQKLLSAMIQEAHLAVDASAALPGDQRPFFLSRLSSLTEHQKRQLERIQDLVGPEDREVLNSYIEMCGACCNWMRQAPESTERNRSDPSSDERWRTWRDNCPMEGCGCGH